MAAAAPLLVECPQCGEHLDIPLTVVERGVVDGNLVLDVDSDLSALQAHTEAHRAFDEDGS